LRYRFTTDSTTIIPQQRSWDLAREQYLNAPGLTAADRAHRQQLLHSSPAELIAQLKVFESQESLKRPRRWAARLQPLIDWLERFGPALDVFANADHYGILALVWGSLRVLIVVMPLYLKCSLSTFRK
jgi:hypothetical protein